MVVPDFTDESYAPLVLFVERDEVFTRERILELRAEMRQRFRDYFEQYGRNFVNVFRHHFHFPLCTAVGFVPDFYHAKPDLDTELERFDEFMKKQDTTVFLRLITFFVFTAINLKRKKEYAEKIGTCDINKKHDWGLWVDELKRKANKLHTIHGGFYRKCFFNFLYPAHKSIHGSKNVREPPILIDDDNAEGPAYKDYSEVLDWISNYRDSQHCGFMYGMLDNFFDEVFAVVDRSLPDAIAIVSNNKINTTNKKKKAVGEEMVDSEAPPFTVPPLPNRYNGFANYEPPVMRQHSNWFGGK